MPWGRIHRPTMQTMRMAVESSFIHSYFYSSLPPLFYFYSSFLLFIFLFISSFSFLLSTFYSFSSCFISFIEFLFLKYFLFSLHFFSLVTTLFISIRLFYRCSFLFTNLPLYITLRPFSPAHFTSHLSPCSFHFTRFFHLIISLHPFLIFFHLIISFQLGFFPTLL